MPEPRKRKKLSKKQRKAVYDKCGGHCAYCGCELEFKDMQVDHVTSFHDGGADTMDNFLPSCRSCNHYKSILGLEEFRKWMQGLPAKMNLKNTNFRTMLRFGIITVDDSPVRFYFEKMGGKENETNI